MTTIAADYCRQELVLLDQTIHRPGMPAAMVALLSVHRMNVQASLHSMEVPA